MKSEVPIKAEEASNYLPFFSEHPLFAIYSPSQLKDLICDCTVQAYQTNACIVCEGDIVNAVYFIVKGQCEVRKRVINNDESVELPIATLREGESIGLSVTGFFSSTGSRTATVVAMSEAIVLKIDINIFRLFLRNHFKEDDLSKFLDTLKRMNFIKSAAPFATIPHEKIKLIAEKIEEIVLIEGVTIFEQGDPADACYIITSGMVDVSICSSDGSSKSLAELGPNAIFGETALMMDTPRNATVRTLKPTTLLKINKTLFYEITRLQVNVPEALIKLQFQRMRPVKMKSIDVHLLKNEEGSEIHLLRNISEGKYFQLSEQGLFIWNLLDGETSLNDIVLQFYVKFGVLNVEAITKHIITLYNAGFIHLDIKEKFISKTNNTPRWLKIILQIREIMEYRIAFGQADKWVTRVFNGGARVFFTRPALLLWFLISTLGFFSFTYHFKETIQLLSVSEYKWRLFFLMNFVVLFTIPIHELAHAFATKYYGRIVHCFGLGWLWLGPFAFCDTSDMWLSPRKQRVMVDLAGIYLNIILAGIAGLCTFITYPASVNLTICLVLFTLYSYLWVIGNLNTAFELDGYYALMDILDKPNLRLSAIHWITQLFSSKKLNKNEKDQVNFSWASLSQHYKEVIYWLVTLIYIFVIGTVLPYIVLMYLLSGLLGIHSPFIIIILTLIAVILSSLGLYKDVLKSRTNKL